MTRIRKEDSRLIKSGLGITSLAKKILFGVSFTAFTAFAFGQPCTPWSNPNGVWKGKGRIAISSDGNEHDKDDWAATPLSLALLASRGLQNQLVLYTFSDHVWGSNHEQSTATAQMRNSALNGKINFGFNNSNFIEAVANPEAAYTAMKNEILKSTAADPFIVVCAGPMQVIGTAIDRAFKDAGYTDQLKYVTLISHSDWNDKHADSPSSWESHSGWQWSEIKSTYSSKGLIMLHIGDQNGGTGYDGLNAIKSKWNWINTSPARNNPLYKSGSWDWLFERLTTATKGNNYDASDSGMIIYLLTGNSLTDPSNAQALMENPVAPCGGTNNPPTAPTNLVVSAITQNSLTLSWTASTDDNGVTGYEVFNGTTLVKTVTAPSASITGLTCNTNYSFTVKAYDAGNLRSAASAPVSAITNACVSTDTIPPSVPANLNASSVSQTSLTLSWTASTDNVAVTGYNVYDGAVLVISVTTTSATITGLGCATSHTYAVRSKDAAGNLSGPSSSLIVSTSACGGINPVAYYTFENNVNDSQGTNNGTVFGSPTYVVGIEGNAISFNGTNDYVTIPRTISADFTIAFWINTTQVAPNSTSWYGGAGLVDGEVVGYKNDFGVSLIGGQIAFGVGNTDKTIKSTSSVNNNVWHHVAATRNSTSGEMKIYIDGALQTTATGPTGAKADAPSLHIGNLQTNTNYFKGALDNIRIYNSVLTQSDIQALFSTKKSKLIAKDKNDNLKLLVSPNPAKENVRINCAGFESVKTVSVNDLQGRKIYSCVTTENEINISKSLRSGLYIISVTDGINTSKQKLIVE